MTQSRLRRRARGSVTLLFAAALDGHPGTEHDLRELARTDDLAADALCALAVVTRGDAVAAGPADIAATDQMIAAVLEAVAGTPQSGMSGSR